MPLKKKSFLDRLTGWWRGAPSRPRKRPMSREECESDPDSALVELQEEQSLIAQELEDTLLAYDKKLQAAARRLAGLDDEPVTKKELAKLRAEQLELWRLVRRAQAASRSTRELKRELKEWSNREPGAAPFGHPDHPGTRAELVSSELRVRGVEVGERKAVSGSGTAIRLPLAENPAAPVPDWRHDDDEMLLREIRSRRREMERFLENGADEKSALELAGFASELRDLHTHLRLHDRRNGIERERWGLGMPGQVDR